MSKYWVIISQFHHLDYLDNAVSSVLNQKGVDDIKVLLINDDPDIRLTDAISIHPRVIMLDDGLNKGQAARFNQGIDYAVDHGAEWISFLGADDWICDTRYLVLEAYIKATDAADVWYTGYVEYLYTDKHNFSYRSCDWMDKEKYKLRNHIAAGTVIVKAELAKEIKFDEDLRYGEDWVWHNRLLQAGANFGFIQMPTLFYRLQSSTIKVRDNIPRHRLNLARLKKRIKGIYE